MRDNLDLARLDLPISLDSQSRGCRVIAYQRPLKRILKALPKGSG